MSGGCLLCAKSLDRMHHPTGRDHNDVYLDKMFVWPLCHDCHEFLHDDWRHENIDKLKVPRTIVEYQAIRVRRLGLNLGRMDQFLGQGSIWGAQAEAMAGWADEVDDHVQLLDQLFPVWRLDGRFMR